MRNALVVTEDAIHQIDIGVRDGRIAAIEEQLAPGVEDVDASGLYLLPGGVDSHVHVDQAFSSGAGIADDFDIGSASALAGETTTIISFIMPFEGLAVEGAVVTTYLHGKKAFNGVKVLAQPGDGVFLPRAPCAMIEPTGYLPGGFDPFA